MKTQTAECALSVLSLPVLLWLASVSAIAGEAPFRFVNVAAEAGIAEPVRNGGAAKDWIAEANGSGAAVLDYDNDGWMDILLTSGAKVTDLAKIVTGGKAAADSTRVRLYRNRGDGTFENVARRAGLSSLYWPTGSNAADFDGDSDVDILVTTMGLDLLYRNDGEKGFSEIGASAGLSREPSWHTGSAFGDYDGDGDLDLYVAGYLELKTLTWSGQAPVCNYRGLDAFCGPRGLQPASDKLYRNEGDGTFLDVSQATGIGRLDPGYGFTPVFEDFNGDRRLDIFVTNDSSPNFLLLNQGDGTFREDALVAGLAYNSDGRQQADMGVAVGDSDGNGAIDILTTTFSEDYFPLFRQQDDGVFEDFSAQAGLRQATMPYLGWGCGFADFDNDGDLDLWVANGHVYPEAGKLGSTTYHQPILIFENRAGLFSVSQGAVEGVSVNSYRGGAAGDFNNDGRMDLVVVPIDGDPVLLENRSAAANNWIGFGLTGRMNREAIGARVEVSACGKKQARWVRNGGGYASKSDARLHFGLADCEGPVSATVQWPGGRKQDLENLETGRWLSVAEPE